MAVLQEQLERPMYILYGPAELGKEGGFAHVFSSRIFTIRGSWTCEILSVHVARSEERVV